MPRLNADKISYSPSNFDQRSPYRSPRSAWESGSIQRPTNLTSPLVSTRSTCYDSSPISSGQCKALKEAFMLNLGSNISPINGDLRTPTNVLTSPIGGSTPSHRYAGIERLAQRQKIYDASIPIAKPLFNENPIDDYSHQSPRRSVLNDQPKEMSVSPLSSSTYKAEQRPKEISITPLASSTYHVEQPKEMSFSLLASPTYRVEQGPKEVVIPKTSTRSELTRTPEPRLTSVQQWSPNPIRPISPIVREIEKVEPRIPEPELVPDLVGFYKITDQITRKALKKGFEFTIMVAGESGLGKSTLINSMFLSDIYSPEYPGPTKRVAKTMRIDSCRVQLVENNVKLSLTVVDTPGFMNTVDNRDCWQPVTDFIDSQFDDYLTAENSLQRDHIKDKRVHCCLYFIFPSGHSLRAIDIEFMKNLHEKVNIIPVIAKADALTPEECAQFKKNILADLEKYNITTYDFMGVDEAKNRVPFAVVSSSYIVEINGQRRRAREYPWGRVEIDKISHCDFAILKTALTQCTMLDLVETTNNIFYENYRRSKLSATGIEKAIKDEGKNPIAQLEEEKLEHDVRLKKLEREMMHTLNTKVREAEQRKAAFINEINQENDKAVAEIAVQRDEIDQKRAALIKEREALDLMQKDIQEGFKSYSFDSNEGSLRLAARRRGKTSDI